MKHRVGFNRLGRKPAHRKALHRNMVTSLFRHERIRTTKAKAREIRRTAEKMITRAKVDSVHNRRMVGRDVKDQEILAKLFVEIGPRFAGRPGGYTRMLKIGRRGGDASEMVILELVRDEVPEKKTARQRKRQSVAPTAGTGTTSPVVTDAPPAAAPSADMDVAEEGVSEAAASEAASESEDKES